MNDDSTFANFDDDSRDGQPAHSTRRRRPSVLYDEDDGCIGKISCDGDCNERTFRHHRRDTSDACGPTHLQGLACLSDVSSCVHLPSGSQDGTIGDWNLFSGLSPLSPLRESQCSDVMPSFDALLRRRDTSTTTSDTLEDASQSSSGWSSYLSGSPRATARDLIDDGVPRPAKGGGHQAKHWCFTINNPLPEDFDRLQTVICDYIVAQEERGESGTRHIQGLICFATKIRAAQVKQKIGTRCHLEIMRGTIEQADAYCR